MKKWTLHLAFCILNATAATAFFILIIYAVFFSFADTVTSDDIGLLFLIFLCYAIYILTDLWGIKLYYWYKYKTPLSFVKNRISSAILFFNFVVQVGCGFLVSELLLRYLFDLNSTITTSTDGFWVMGLLIIFVFFSSVIIFITSILLVKAIKKEQLLIKKEISNIGIDQS